MSKPEPDIWDLIKSTLFPLDYDEVHRYIQNLRTQAKNTNWSSLSNRLEGVALLIILFGIISFIALYFYQSQFDLSLIQTLGVQFVIGVFVVTLLISAKSVVLIIENINHGETVFGDDSGRDDIVGRLLASVLFLAIPTYVIMQIEIGIVELTTLFILSCIIIGSVIVGCSSVFKSVWMLREYLI